MNLLEKLQLLAYMTEKCEGLAKALLKNGYKLRPTKIWNFIRRIIEVSIFSILLPRRGMAADFRTASLRVDALISSIIIDIDSSRLSEMPSAEHIEARLIADDMLKTCRKCFKKCKRARNPDKFNCLLRKKYEMDSSEDKPRFRLGNGGIVEHEA